MAKRILIIDDRSEVLDIIQEVLIYSGFEVYTAFDASEVFMLIEQKKPDLLLIDYLLGGVDGGSVCKLIKSSYAVAFLPVIIFSAYSDRGLGPGSFGCEDFISKPIDINELITKVTYHSSFKVSHSQLVNKNI